MLTYLIVVLSDYGLVGFPIQRIFYSLLLWVNFFCQKSIMAPVQKNDDPYLAISV